jgi:exodeoxyribonuclease-3
MSLFKIATWNVNSLRVRLPHVLAWLGEQQPTVLALQETKLPDTDFPIDEIKAVGYHVVFSGQRTYNGVAILSKSEMTDVVTDIPTLTDPQRRILAVTVDDVRILNLYVPNGESVTSEKYQYKLSWLKQVDAYAQQELQKHRNMIVLGDFNIAPDDIDVHDPKAWEDSVLCSARERIAFQQLLKHGFHDSFRELHSDEQLYSWWDYRLNAFKRNLGLRIDHILASTELMSVCCASYIDQQPRALERPSDHAPVIAEFMIAR